MDNSEEAPKKRRRSSRKSSKVTYQRRRELKRIGYWIVLGVIGILIVTTIAIFAGRSGSTE